MKIKTLLTFLIFAAAFVPDIAFSQTVISGKWDRKKKGIIKLYEVNLGRLEEVASTNLGADNTFGFAFFPKEEAFYVIGNDKSSGMQDKYPFYLKKNDRLSVTITDTSYNLTGINSPENKVIEDWHNMIVSLERQSVYTHLRRTYVGYFPALEDVLQKLKTRRFASTGNKKFDQWFAEIRELDLVAYSTGMVYYPRMKMPAMSDLPAYYSTLDLRKYTSDTRLFRYYSGQAFLVPMLFVCNMVATGSRPSSLPESMLREIPNDTIKGELAVLMLETTRSFPDFLNKEEGLKGFILTADQKKRQSEARERLAIAFVKEGNPATELSGQGISGKTVSLSDLKGKVVLIDFWATWCTPCIAEIPYLKKLEEEFHNEDIVFLSMSIDAQKDHDKWEQFVKKEGLTGLQLIANNQQQLVIEKMYSVKTIPRFVVINKDGTIASLNAPRPSRPELKALLKDLLKK